MHGSRNFHERGSNENCTFWSQTRGGPTPQKSRNYLFLGTIFKFQGGSGPPPPPPPPLDPRMLIPWHCCSYITKTCPYNIQRIFSAVKIKNFIRKMLMFLTFLLKTLIMETLSCFGAKIRKIGIPLHTPFLLCKSGV